MTWWLSAWTAFAAFTAAVWLARHLVFWKIERTMPPLKADPTPPAPEGSPPLTAIVAAKDEERNIERCVRSILRQDYPALRVIAVNDRSRDRTGEILDRLASEDARLSVVHVTQLRPGWFGKNNAMHEGVGRAASEWLFFTDADCTLLSPHTLSTAMRYARARNCDFLSVLPVLEAHGLLEQIIQPACSGILLIWFNPLFVNDPRNTTAYANGAFMLMSRRVYDAVGGHEPVKTEVNEDIHLARRAKQLGLSLRVVGNEDLYRVRMYESLGQMWRGWSRIFYGSFGSARRIVASMLMVMLGGIQPWASWAVGAWMSGASTGPEAWRPLMWAGMAASLFQVSVMFRYYRATRVPAWLAPTYPIAALLALGMLISALRRVGGRGTTTWRGTTYRGDVVVSGEATRT
ncbi:MAG: glycosyltransferase [Phycisphaerae bacterium]|nr:glycosyltransferase [Phycisphaerae bacterium]NUQ44758.1 glycosyltransferase [Phycisphaerae bacterium]